MPDPSKPPGDAPARRPVRAAQRRRLPENLAVTVRLDRRTTASKMAEAFRADLVAHVGGKPSATQAALIEQAVQIKLRLFSLDTEFGARGTQSAHDGRQYLAWSNSLSRLLRQLGLKGVAQQPPSLGDYLAGRATPATPAPAKAP